MDLFNPASTENILPYDGKAMYYGKILNTKEALNYTDVFLKTIHWKNDEAIIFGKHIVTARKVAWYAGNTFSYTYSGTTKQALLWTKELLELKKLVEAITGASYNSCLLNLYHTGSEGMAYHSDDEKTLGKDSSIASLSLGAERKFLFRHKTNKQTISIVLENGSLLEMKGSTQTYWLHRLPTTTKVHKPRINLTFRSMIIA
jgi:alkylated DNA repair dioxygenase AlkB